MAKRIYTPEQRERKRAYDAERYSLIAEWKRQSARESYGRNREKVCARQMAKNHAKAIASGRKPGMRGAPTKYTDDERTALKVARQKEWRRNNPEKLRAQGIVHNGNRRARLNGTSGYIRRGDLEVLWGRQRGVCALCDEPFGKETPHVDHWIPIARGGSHELENLSLLHRECNLRKWAKLPHEMLPTAEMHP